MILTEPAFSREEASTSVLESRSVWRISSASKLMAKRIMKPRTHGHVSAVGFYPSCKILSACTTNPTGFSRHFLLIEKLACQLLNYGEENVATVYFDEFLRTDRMPTLCECILCIIEGYAFANRKIGVSALIPLWIERRVA